MTLSIENKQIATNIAHNHVVFADQACRAGLVTFFATFILISAAIVITSGAYCLSIRGVRVLEDFVYPVVIPFSASIALSIPLIILAVKLTEEKQRTHRTHIIEPAKKLVASEECAKLTDAKLIAQFLIDHVVPKKASVVHKQKLLADLKAECVPEENPTPAQELFSEGCQEAVLLLTKSLKKGKTDAKNNP